MHVRRRRLQPGHVRRDAQPRRAVAAAGGVHGHQQPVRHGHRAAPPLRRHRPAAQGREPRRAGHALRRHGRARHLRASCARRCARVREERRPLLVEAVTYRFRGHSMADPEQYRTQARRSRTGASATRSPRSASCWSRGRDRRGGARADRRARRSRAWTRRWSSPRPRPFPAPESLYDDVYVLDRGGARLVLRGAAGRARRALAARRRRRCPAGGQRRDPPAAHARRSRPARTRANPGRRTR